MKRLAGAFSALALAALVTAALFLFRPAPPPALLPLTGQVDRIVVEKAARRMLLVRGDTVLRTYAVALGFAPTGDKMRKGDGRTPEGLFRIDRRNDQSGYHLSLGLDYPQPDDRIRAQATGFSPGGDIMIHGQPNALPDGTTLRGDWTAGCVALSNAEIREVWAVTRTGTIVEIKP